MANVPGTPGDDILYGTDDDDTITGIGGNDHLFGFGGNDSIDGGDGSDIIDGGTGADMMAGGIGDDYYVVDDAGDVVTEASGAGADLVFTTIDYTLPDNVERLAVYSRTTTFAVNLTGNALVNELIGNNGANILDGGAGADIMQGGEGDDTYIVDVAGDSVREISNATNGGIDTVRVNMATGNALHGTFDYSIRPNVTASTHVDSIERIWVFDAATVNSVNLMGNALGNDMRGNAGINLLDGFTGADTMAGYGGDDWYFVDNAGDVVTEQAGEGIDTVFIGRATFTTQTLGFSTYTLSDHVERVSAAYGGYSNGLTLNGNALDNEMTGGDSANVINGGVGADIMIGKGGNDTYYVDNVGDQVIETTAGWFSNVSGGSDTVITTINYGLTPFVENLQTADANGTAPLALTGNAFVNAITGNAGANVIDGGGDADVMTGLGGDDVYIVDNAGDDVIEAAGGGSDLVFIANFNYVLRANFERGGAFDRSSLQAFNLTGNDVDNELWGNDGANVIDGKLGRDVLTGEGGADTFAFTTVVDGGNADLILDFEVGIDKVALDDALFTGLAAGTLSAAAFNTGRFASDADDRILYEWETGNLFFDRDGTGPIEAQFFGTLADRLTVTASDFVVI